MEQNPVLSAHGLERAFGPAPVLRGVTLSLAQGEIYGLLGPNGAGKTTLLKLLAGLLRPDAGAARVCGLEVEENRSTVLAQLGILIETPVFYDHLSAAENLELHLAYMGREGDVPAALARVGLADAGRKPVGSFSLGMRQRLALARAIVHRPRVLLLDEPLNGLDPVVVGELRQLFQSLAGEGLAILMSSHILSEVLHTAHRVGVLSQGRLVLEERVSTLQAAHPWDLEDYLVGQMAGGVR